MISHGGDLGFFLDSEEPATPSTRDAVILEANDAITVSTITYESAKRRLSSPSSIAGSSTSAPPIIAGAAKDSSPAGEPPPKRAVQPVSDEVKFERSPLSAEAIVELTADNQSNDGRSPSGVMYRQRP